MSNTRIKQTRRSRRTRDKLEARSLCAGRSTRRGIEEGSGSVARWRLLGIPAAAVVLALAVIGAIHGIETYDADANAEDVSLRLPLSKAGTGTIDCQILGGGSGEAGGRPVRVIMIAPPGRQEPRIEVACDPATRYTETTATADALPSKDASDAIQTAHSVVRLTYVKRAGWYWAVEVRELRSGWRRASN